MVDRLLHACPLLTILASSREALGIAGERPYQVPSLSLPEDKLVSPETLIQSEAVHLCIERAQIALPGFLLNEENAPAQSRICRRLDGIPLAIELAAARMKSLRAEQVAARLFEASASIHKALGRAIDPGDVADFKDFQATSRADLSDKAFTTAWAEGQAMSLGQATAYALGKI